eukprot:1156086-Pelagomonas_calceolata.AAC.1
MSRHTGLASQHHAHQLASNRSASPCELHPDSTTPTSWCQAVVLHPLDPTLPVRHAQHRLGLPAPRPPAGAQLGGLPLQQPALQRGRCLPPAINTQGCTLNQHTARLPPAINTQARTNIKRVSFFKPRVWLLPQPALQQKRCLPPAINTQACTPNRHTARLPPAINTQARTDIKRVYFLSLKFGLPQPALRQG